MKKLLAIAVAAGLAIPATVIADTTLYGKLHASFGSTKNTHLQNNNMGGNDPTKDDASRIRTESHNSRLGVKGSTPLNNGLAATYQLEYGLNVDGEPGKAISARNTWVGLKKARFGEVRIGRHDTPHKLSTGSLDLFSDTYADYNNIIETDRRANNAVAYINKFGPVGVAVAHVSRDTGAKGSHKSAAGSLMVNYAKNGLYAGLGYEQMAGANDHTKLGAGYTFPAGHKIGAIYGNSKPRAGGDTQKEILVNGGAKLGKTFVKAQYGKRDPGGNAGTEKLTSLGIDYSLGKKTTGYVLFSENKNPTAALNNNDKATAGVVGIIHNF